MKAEKEMKKKVKSVFYEEGEPPSNKNYFIILAVVILAGFVFYLIFSLGVDTRSENGLQTQQDLPKIETSSDVTDAISNMSDILSNVSGTLDEIDEKI
ncbi:MAG: hypothetical protein NT129_04055 [Candidatus Aenigmarchaeota archaeon]|jgi:hypothetical protein|nr:hypothetical protein [Candidatus Aenigmarchaeota archaeon]